MADPGFDASGPVPKRQKDRKRLPHMVEPIGFERREPAIGIRTSADLTEALQEIDRLWGAPRGTRRKATGSTCWPRSRRPTSGRIIRCRGAPPVGIPRFARGGMGRWQDGRDAARAAPRLRKNQYSMMSSSA
ncbi:putative transcription regulator [Methylorubrum populi]|uniref:Putative transcription regulator n=1 Tax=Methylorubrum populi TaxID=223967 RepID=A0A160PB97_9HYPH|nr:putative transcription regulator [Methylorubrum populi]